MKRIWNSIGKNVKDTNFQAKAVNYVEKLEKGETKVHAPKYPDEIKRGPVKISEDVKKDLDTKHETLIDNMNKMTIKSTDPVERWTSVKFWDLIACLTLKFRDLPTRESELLHRNDPMWEYGFYEPSLDRIPKNKLMFREVLEVLRARQELSDDPRAPTSKKGREKASEALAEHPAVQRVDGELLDDIFEYFRPFERKDTQKVVNKHQLAELQDHLQGMADQRTFLGEGQKNIKDNFSKNQLVSEEYHKLDANEKKKFQEAVLELREAEHQRLQKRLGEIEKMEATVEAINKEGEKKKQ